MSNTSGPAQWVNTLDSGGLATAAVMFGLMALLMVSAYLYIRWTKRRN